jgi:hypothetical protein
MVALSKGPVYATAFIRVRTNVGYMPVRRGARLRGYAFADDGGVPEPPTHRHGRRRPLFNFGISYGHGSGAWLAELVGTNRMP